MFKGSMVALVTPFKNGKVDEKALEALIEFQGAVGGGFAPAALPFFAFPRPSAGVMSCRCLVITQGLKLINWLGCRLDDDRQRVSCRNLVRP